MDYPHPPVVYNKQNEPDRPLYKQPYEIKYPEEEQLETSVFAFFSRELNFIAPASRAFRIYTQLPHRLFFIFALAVRAVRTAGAPAGTAFFVLFIPYDLEKRGGGERGYRRDNHNIVNIHNS